MGWWFVFCWLDAGVPGSVMLYTHQDEQRCLNLVEEHLAQRQQNRFVEVIYTNCIQGGAPRR